MNIENKKQFATLLLAVALGLAAAYLTGMYVKNSVEMQTQSLAEEYKQRNDAVINEVALVKKSLDQMAQKQKRLEQMAAQIPQQLAAQQQAQQQQQQVQQQQEEISKTNFSLRTPIGKRAVTLMIDSLSAVGGLIGPGDFVDIIGKLQVPDSEKSNAEKKEVISVLMQNVQVLAVGVNFTPLSGNVQTYDLQQKTRSLNITLAVDPNEAGLLAFAQANGRLQLSLRAPKENRTSILKVASWDTLSDYVLDRQGTELLVPTKVTNLEEVEEEENQGEVKPFIQIFKQGREL